MQRVSRPEGLHPQGWVAGREYSRQDRVAGGSPPPPIPTARRVRERRTPAGPLHSSPLWREYSRKAMGTFASDGHDDDSVIR